MDNVTDLLGYLVLLFVFFVLPALLNRMAKKRAAQQAQRREAGGAPAAAEEPEVARTSQVERYLESLGIKVERQHAPPRPRPAQPPPPPPTLRPGPPPAVAERVVYEARPEEVKRFLDEIVARPAAPPPPPPRPVRVRVPTPRRTAPAAAGPAMAGPPEPEASAPAPIRPRRPLGVLGHRPDRTELQRAVILSEIIRRPDFDRSPFERELIP